MHKNMKVVDADIELKLHTHQGIIIVKNQSINKF